MSEENKAAAMREFVAALSANDSEKAASLCTDDVVWVNPFGTFKGKEGLKRYFDWTAQTTRDFKVSETGNGILVQGDKAFFEHTVSGVIQGEKYNILTICAYVFDDGKIKELRTALDRLSLAEQASSKWLPKKLVSSIVSQMGRGL